MCTSRPTSPGIAVSTFITSHTTDDLEEVLGVAFMVVAQGYRGSRGSPKGGVTRG